MSRIASTSLTTASVASSLVHTAPWTVCPSLPKDDAIGLDCGTVIFGGAPHMDAILGAYQEVHPLAEGWEERVLVELAASGERARRRREPADTALSSQETRVALLVAQGMTNREVATSLFLSPKTVEHHLSAVLRKRGLRSRTELAHDLGGASG